MRPPIQRQAAERCAQSASSDFHDEPASAAEWPDSESPDTNPRPTQECRPEEHRAVREPREEQERGHEREAECHRDERRPEPRPRDRREVAVEQPAERKLQRVLGSEDERCDSDVERHQRADPRHRVEPLLRASGQTVTQHQQPEAQPADEQRQREEVQPAHDVLAPCRPRCSECLRRGRCVARERRT